MNKPRPLRAGDRVGVVAPASGCTPEELEGGVAELRRLGFEPLHTDAVARARSLLGGHAR